MPNILLGVSGGIAAYKALELIRLATAAGHSLRVVQTPTSRRFVGELSFAALSGAPVLVDELEPDPARGAFPGEQPPSHQPLSHLRLAERADLYLIAPASANTIAKLAHGFADNLLTSCALAADCPLVVAPAMNNRMYEHPSTQSNLKRLRERAVHIVEPSSGRLASIGEHGIGRLAEPARLLQECERILSARVPTERVPAGDFSGVRVLVTAGGTREPIDSVRFVGNSSSGRMGIALAERAARRGAHVTLIAANVALPAPESVQTVAVSTATELQNACEQRFDECDVLLMAAAVADFRPVTASAGKIKKRASKRLEIELEPTADVLSGLSERRRPGQTLVGFAAEHGPQAVQTARVKLSDKRLDALVVNDVSRADIGFESEHNEVTILSASAERHVAKTSKTAVADAILDEVQRLRSA